MARIRILDDHIQNRIAAGEVIERPASVVKELVENAIDAGARKITVEVGQGGISSIRVSDDGAGIPADELELALARHATSKITDSDDLFRIHTMGFRGEALPSIASVSRFSLSSRVPGAQAGGVVAKEGSGPLMQSDVGMAEGTAVAADTIFFNVPARRKFLKTPATELKHISSSVLRISLAYPEIHFTLKNNKSEILHLPSCSKTEERLLQAFGKKISSNILSTEQTAGPFTIHVFGVKPGVTRRNSQSIYSYVNRRYFRGKEVIHALKEGYKRHIPHDEWPFAVLFIESDPDVIDVNVHPNKTEVRFKEPGELHSLIKNAVTGLLRQSELAVSYPVSDQPQAGKTKTIPGFPSDRKGDAEWIVREKADMFGAEPYAPSEKPGLSEAVQQTSGLRFMQVYDSYIVVEYEDRITVYDQHALHEGIIEQKLREKFRENGLPYQDLLIPEQIELTPEEKAVLLELKTPLSRFGFDLQDFSGNTVVIHSVPQIMDTSSIGRFINDMISIEPEFTDEDEEISENLLSVIINRIACHSSVRAGQKLTAEEIDELLRAARAYPDSASCAHGRPSSFDIPKSELSKRFKRT